MTYKVLSVVQSGDTITTEVEYSINGTIVTVRVPHFQPVSLADVLQGIANRATSESQKLDAVTACEALVSKIKTGEVIVL